MNLACKSIVIRSKPKTYNGKECQGSNHRKPLKYTTSAKSDAISPIKGHLLLKIWSCYTQNQYASSKVNVKHFIIMSNRHIWYNLTLSVPGAPLFCIFWKVCNAVIRQPIELESCSNLYRFSKSLTAGEKKFFHLDFGFSEGDVTMRACFCIFGEFTWPWAPTQWAIFFNLLGPGRQPNEP